MNYFVTDSNQNANQLNCADQIIDQIDVVLCSFQKGPNKKELIAKPGIALSAVRYDLGGGFQVHPFDSVDDALDFYNQLAL